ncbi:17-beta-hydroxysteroid dehydrogenase 13-like [Pollicipes pollicipes]|uniref:17-beta-hydroxysteroid dehydrogenase 13-like n=1 Tax=Pollicipes pollicipes TaxID=41117 RepID=UPI0018858743|nr:17-beta-hydroxysteroid dehydrogenase 13-like [Pollicipes pollicipes]XP_037083461.1 17-beta-hydroxysteroid dehydrogenase 13-like [Pollicipes pollicipes]
MIYLVTPIFRLFVLALDILEFLWGAYWDVVWTFLYLVFDKPMKSICGKTVLITGAANGVGRALAFAFAKQGCNVICWDVEEAGNQATAEEVQKAYEQVRSAAYCVDVSDREQVERAANKVREDFSFVDILVNNAGIMPAKQFLCHTPEEIKRIFNVNVFSQYWTLRALLPDMQRAGRGTVISISSNCGLMGSPNLVPYCASKHAVRGLMEALTEEGRHLSKKRQPPVHYLTVFPFIINTRLAKYPRVRFPWLTPVLTPEYVAAETVKALMEGEEVLFFPKWMYPFFLFSRIWPRRTQQRFYDLLDTGLDENQFDVADQMRHFNAH